MKGLELQPEGYEPNLPARQSRGRRWKLVFLGATILSVFFLIALVSSIVDQAFGYVLTMAEVDPESLARDGLPLEKLDAAALDAVLSENVSRRLYRKLEAESPLASRPREELLALIEAEVIKPKMVASWNLSDSLFKRAEIRALAERDYPEGRLVFRAWVNAALFRNPQSADALMAGIRGAILGSLLTIFFTILIALPLGVGSAIWLVEYAKDNRLNRVIQTNIYNLAGVPSIIYGMLGLALFVRGLEPLTSGALFGLGAEGIAGGLAIGGADGGSANGRTILSAALTLALLVLPIVIINAEEALKAVPGNLRQSSLAMGATKWQTIWHHVLPASIDRILTGAVLAISRALGETAPLVVVGASTFLSQDPTGPFSKFTTLPIQIYQWTARPQPEFRKLAAAAILVLLILLLSLNAAAIYARNKYRKNKRLGR